MENVNLYQGDCLERMRSMDSNSVDSIVTDPPYGLSFMGKKWDYDVPSQEIWEECMRVLKPGGHLLAFAGSRTYHRMAVRIEDAGFEIRDQIMWLYGSGFPKSHNVGKQIDKMQGNTRRFVGYRVEPETGRVMATEPSAHKIKDASDEKYGKDLRTRKEAKVVTKGDTEWEGWGTALKPAHEPIVVARKPLSEKTVAANVLKWGTGAINIDDSRISTVDNLNGGAYSGGQRCEGEWKDNSGFKNDMVGAYSQPTGRFPANIILDEEAGRALDAQSGITKSGKVKSSKGSYSSEVNTGFLRGVSNHSNQHGDSGGASRFFYCPKTSKTDRNEGLEGFEAKEAPKRDDGQPYGMNTNKFRPDGSERKPVQPKRNNHPTVKPTDLMLYLIRLVTPRFGITFDPFMGSGSTGKAAVRGGFKFIGMELDGGYVEIAKARIRYEHDNPFVEKRVVKAKPTNENKKNDNQQKLF